MKYLVQISNKERIKKIALMNSVIGFLNSNNQLVFGNIDIDNVFDFKIINDRIFYAFQEVGSFTIQTDWIEDRGIADDGMAEFDFSDQLLIRVTADRKQDFLDYLYANEDLFAQQINNYPNILSVDDETMLILVETLPVLSQVKFNGVFKARWMDALIKERPEDCENTIITILSGIDNIQDKRAILSSLMNDKCNIRYYTGHLNSENEKTYVIKIAQFLKEVIPPDIQKLKMQNFNYMGGVYEKILEWEETLGPDIIFQSDQSNYTCDIIVNTKTDWISILQDDEYLMTLDPFEYVGITASKGMEHGLPTGFVAEESIAIIPGFLLHWLLHYEEREQVLNDVATLADMGFTLVTLGTYAAGKNLIVYGGKYATGALVDMVLQVGIEALKGNSFEEGLDNIDYGQVFYSGVESLMPGWKTQAIIGCLRGATVAPLAEGSFDLSSVAESCFENIFWNIVSHGAIQSGSAISKKLQKAVESEPGNVVKNLKGIGFDKDMIEWIAAHTGVELTDFIEDNF